MAMEEALWRLEDRWKLSTREAIAALIVSSICVLFIVITAVVFLLKKRSRKSRGSVHQVPAALVRTGLWSGGSKWDRNELLDGAGRGRSHSSSSAVWQRPILMGEKCELPRFSGLILYDQSGSPLPLPMQESSSPATVDQTVKTTLKDYLLCSVTGC